MGDLLKIRDLTPADLSRLWEIDRSEHLHVRFTVEDGQLLSGPLEVEVPGWDPVGTGHHSVAGMIEFAQPIVARGAHFLGAFDNDELAGIVIVDLAFGPDTVWLALLSRGCRLASWAEVSDDLYDLEPEDIHLICDLAPTRHATPPAVVG